MLPVARRACAPDWREGRDLLTLLERFTHSERWDDAALVQAAYEQHNATVRASVPRERLLEWRATEGWAPLCHAQGLPVPEQAFPWVPKRSEWG